MLVFNNQQRGGYEEIVSYIPKFYLKIREMDAVFRFAGWTNEHMASNLEFMIAYQFIRFMNDEVLVRFEAFIHIETDKTKTLDERKIIAAAKYAQAGKLSKTKIKTIVNSFTDCECSVDLKGSQLVINMVFTDNPTRYMNEIRNLISDSIPSHISILYKGIVDIVIIFGWFSKVNVEQISNRMTFRMYNPDSYIYLDGVRHLNGTRLLEKGFYVFPVEMVHRLFVTHLECLDLKTGFNMKMINNPHTTEIMSLKTAMWVVEAVTVLTTHKLNVEHKESTEEYLTVKNNLYYLDGEELLGGRKLSAYISEEEL